MAHHSRFGLRISATTTSILLILMISMIGLAACNSSSTTAPKATATAHSANGVFKFDIVTDGPISDPFWALVKKGADKAAADMGVTVAYQAPTAVSVSAVGTLIDNAVSTNPDGLVVSIPDCSGLSTHIKQALLVGIPVVSIHSGSTCATSLGLLNYIGQTDYQAGLAGGQRLATAGAKHVLCVNPQVGNTDLDSRCRGVSDALKKDGGKSDVFRIDLSNSGAAEQKLQALLVQDPSIDAVITLSTDSASLAIAASQNLIRAHPFFLATFDLSAPVLQSIQQGHMLFAIDQQPYLQGYLSVILLTLYKKNLDTVASPTVATGPVFVTSANVAQIEQLESAGTR